MNVNFSKAVLWTLAAVFFYSCGHGASAAISRDVSVYQIQFLQYSSASLFLFFFFKSTLLQKPSNLKLYLFRCATGMASAFTFIMSIRHLNLLDATLLNITSQFYMPMIGTIWLKEKYSKLIWPMLLLGFCGAALILPPSKQMFQTGALLALSSGLFSALALSSLRALSQRNEETTQVVLFYLIFGTIFTGTMSFFQWHPLTQKEHLLGIFGGLCLGMNQVCLFRAFKLAMASSLAPFNYFAFFFSAIIGWLVFGQPIQFNTLLGALLIGASGILTHQIHSSRQTVRQ
jgi:drug/metabolite transporter (DMT)-like permease